MSIKLEREYVTDIARKVLRDIPDGVDTPVRGRRYDKPATSPQATPFSNKSQTAAAVPTDQESPLMTWHPRQALTWLPF